MGVCVLAIGRPVSGNECSRMSCESSEEELI